MNVRQNSNSNPWVRGNEPRENIANNKYLRGKASEQVSRTNHSDFEITPPLGQDRECPSDSAAIQEGSGNLKNGVSYSIPTGEQHL